MTKYAAEEILVIVHKKIMMININNDRYIWKESKTILVATTTRID